MRRVNLHKGSDLTCLNSLMAEKTTRQAGDISVHHITRRTNWSETISSGMTCACIGLIGGGKDERN